MPNYYFDGKALDDTIYYNQSYSSSSNSLYLSVYEDVFYSDFINIFFDVIEVGDYFSVGRLFFQDIIKFLERNPYTSYNKVVYLNYEDLVSNLVYYKKLYSYETLFLSENLLYYKVYNYANNDVLKLNTYYTAGKIFYQEYTNSIDFIDNKIIKLNVSRIDYFTYVDYYTKVSLFNKYNTEFINFLDIYTKYNTFNINFLDALPFIDIYNIIKPAVYKTILLSKTTNLYTFLSKNFVGIINDKVILPDGIYEWSRDHFEDNILVIDFETLNLPNIKRIDKIYLNKIEPSTKVLLKDNFNNTSVLTLSNKEWFSVPKGFRAESISMQIENVPEIEYILLNYVIEDRKKR